MVELRKRPSTTNVAPPPAKRSSAKKAEPKTKQTPKQKVADPAETVPDPPADEPKAAVASAKSESKALKAGDTITVDGFGGHFDVTDGTTQTDLKDLLAHSEAGIIVFTYPKASTPGCTKQACLFRDSYSDLTASGFDIYGLSRDSVKANSNFVEKQKLQYKLLCDQSGDLIKALGFYKPPKNTTRGVAAISKDGKVLALMAGGPDATVDAVRPVVKNAAAKA